MSDTKYCCKKFKKWLNAKVITKDVLGYWLWLQRDVDHDGDWEIINFCLNCGKELMKQKIIEDKNKPQDTALYASLRR